MNFDLFYFRRQDSEDKKHCVSEPDRCSKSLSFSEDTSEEGKLIVDEILLTGKVGSYEEKCYSSYIFSQITIIIIAVRLVMHMVSGQTGNS